jgi:hypothetical protein
MHLFAHFCIFLHVSVPQTVLQIFEFFVYYLHIFANFAYQGGVKVILELSTKNSAPSGGFESCEPQERK